MSIADKLTKLSTDLTNAYNSIEDKGGTIPTNKNTENLASAIGTITGGVTAYTVTFDSNGGSEVPSQQIVEGYTAKVPDAPIKENYKLRYWALNGVEYDFDTPITSDITLVAVWTYNYTEIEYIESTGTQYIDTGFIPTANSKFELDIQYTTRNSGYRNGIGGVTPNSRMICGLDTSGFYYGVGGLNIDTNYGDLNRHVFIVDLKNMQYGYDSNLKTANTTYLNPNNVPFTLFCRNNTELYDEPVDSFSKQKFYSCKLYDAEILKMDLVPVLDKNNVACLFDKVSKTYFYNAGNGSFTAGSVIL